MCRIKKGGRDLCAKVGLDTAGGRGSAAAEPAAGMRSGWRATCECAQVRKHANGWVRNVCFARESPLSET